MGNSSILKFSIVALILLQATIGHCQTFYVMDESSGIGTPIKEFLTGSSQKVSELPSKADFIIKPELKNGTPYKRPQLKILLVDMLTGLAIYETPFSKFSIPRYNAVLPNAEKKAKDLMEQYGNELILRAQNKYSERHMH